jgi:hypothetical protein
MTDNSEKLINDLLGTFMDKLDIPIEDLDASVHFQFRGVLNCLVMSTCGRSKKEQDNASNNLGK